MRMKRYLEAFVTVVSVLLAAYVVFVWLQMVQNGQNPPQSLMILAVVSVAGALGSAYTVEDIQAVLSLLPSFKFEK